ncbi:hypothetical protein [Arcanobacterium phocae]|nr:hypothetical protein [Arcanobacterium phocae]
MHTETLLNMNPIEFLTWRERNQLDPTTVLVDPTTVLVDLTSTSN